MTDSATTPFDHGLFLVHLNRGREHFERQELAEAEVELERARRMRPRDPTVLNLLGLVFYKQEKYRQADTVYRDLIELSPDSPVLHFNQGLACFKLGALDRAEAAFVRALELGPDNRKIHFYLGNIYERKGQYYNAIFQYRKAGANIMVKRVQDKIRAERASAGAERTQPSDATLPAVATVPPGAAADAPLKVTVDHIDRRRFLEALRESELAPAGTTDAASSPASTEAPRPSPPAPPAPPARPPTDLFSLATEALSRQAAEVAGSADATEPDEEQEEAEPTPRTSPGAPGAESRPGRTVVRLAEPVVQDRPLGEMAGEKSLSQAAASLFSHEPPSRGGADGDDTMRAGAPPVVEPRADGGERGPRVVSLGGERKDDGDRTAPLYQRLRRRDDIFRYLENNLMEVNFSGKVFIKQGTIYTYSGNLTFWVKPQREETAPPLVIVSGTGKLLLTDRRREITVMRIKDEVVFVEPSHLLACQETLTPRYAVIEKEGAGPPRLHVLSIEGTGMIALSVATSPIVLDVTPGYPVNVSSANVISWSGDLDPVIVDDEALAELMLPSDPRAVNLRLEGSGRVMMERS